MLATLPEKLGSWKKIAKFNKATRKMDETNMHKLYPGGL